MSGDARLGSLVSRAHAAGVKVLISFGGWTGSVDSNFEPMAANAAYRAAFVNNVVTFVRNYGLDGVDIDWEFPDDATESAHFSTLMSELDAAMDANGKMLAAAVASTGYYGQWIGNDVFGRVDFLFLMPYARDVQPHAPYSHAVESLDYWSMRGLPKEKTVLGVPFYGRDNATGRLTRPYRKLVADNPTAPQTDECTCLNDSGQPTVFNYNGLATIRQKTALSLQRGSGVGIWELSQDTTLASISLLNAIQEAMNAPVPPHDWTRVVYDDALLWADWSWGVTRDFANASPVYGTGGRSIALSGMAAWGALQPYYGSGVDPSTVTRLELYIHGGTAGGQNLRVGLVDTGGALPRVPLNSYVEGGSVAAGTWRRVSIPMTALGATTRHVTRLVIQEAAGVSPQTFYVDEIRFLP
ncbi:MAG TPA: glycosyl hydrolase family 18 protein [Longimicrobium sp.]|nr:glycosyl hydrolase family 18 protein [Longimicrobium sp.]